ncbi:reverse transcriptase domain-containing protein [Tanacetum coccineum]
MAPDRIAATSKEVEELKKARILRETRYQTWAANTVMIAWKVDSLSDFKLKCFLDAYKGYHQIQMAKEDEHKTTFHAPQEVYCYRKMHFGLKIARATYQRSALSDGRRPIPGARSCPKQEKSLPFFKTPKGCLEKKDFTWTREEDKAFEEMKRYIEKLPTPGSQIGHRAQRVRIEFKPRNIVKAQILAYFLTETKKEDEETDFQEHQLEGQNTRYKLYTDGASDTDGSGAGLMIVNLKGTEFTYALKFKFTTPNNEAKYKTAIAGLRITKEIKIKEITVFVDLHLVANQVNGLYEAKHDHTR